MFPLAIHIFDLYTFPVSTFIRSCIQTLVTQHNKFRQCSSSSSPHHCQQNRINVLGDYISCIFFSPNKKPSSCKIMIKNASICQNSSLTSSYKRVSCFRGVHRQLTDSSRNPYIASTRAFVVCCGNKKCLSLSRLEVSGCIPGEREQHSLLSDSSGQCFHGEVIKRHLPYV